MSNWIESIADRAGVALDEVEKVLANARVLRSTTLPRPRSLRLKRIAFSGTKKLGSNQVPFSFEQTFGPGLLCFASHDNLVGKSSTLEIIRWALRGRSSVQPDVQSWIARVCLDAHIDEEDFTIEFLRNQGSLTGSIRGLAGGEPYFIAQFDSAEQFENSVGAFMLDRFGLESVPFWQKRPGDDEDGDVRMFGWPSLSSVLHVSDKPVLVGDEVMGGQAGRLLQVFLGSPWAPTLFAAKVAERSRDQHTRVLSRRLKEEVRVRQDDTKIRAELEEARAALAALGGPEDLEEVDKAMAASKEAAANVARCRERVEELSRQAREARRIAIEDERAAMDVRETRAARRFFQGLNPTCCPRCDTTVDQARRERENAHLACALCGTNVPVAAEGDDPTHVSEAEARAAGSALASKELEAALHGSQTALSIAEDELRERRGRVQQVTAGRRSERRHRELEVSIARLEGMLAERARVEEALAVPPSDDRAAHILKCAVDQIDRLLKEEDGSLFAELNAETAELARSFGMTGLENVSIERSARMKVRKGGESMWFGDVTAGERMRLKVAVVLALFRVGRKHRIGRHPGFLLVDSPGANEANADDLGDMFRQLNAAADELGIQVVTTTARPDVVQGRLPDSKIRLVKAGDTLW